MKLTPDDLARWSAAGVGPRGPTATCRHLTRRDFLAAGGLTGAAAAASALLPAAVVAADGDNHRKRVLPRPIPQTIQPGAPFHVEFPVHGNEPATITDFDGVVGRAEIQGTGTGFSAGSKEAGLLFDVDIGFMKGRYVGVDNKVHHATFAFVWLDVYRGQFDPLAPNTHQIHDFNLDIDPFPSGLFWTRAVDEDAVKVDEGRREATLQVTNLAVEDYFTLANSLSDGALKPPVNATASFRAEWSGGGQAITIGDGLFQATVIEDAASIRWSAHEDGFAFFSDESTTSVFAVLGRERNGRFL